MKYDYLTLYQKNADFYNAHPRAKQALQLGNMLLTAFFLMAYALLWIFALFVDKFEAEDMLIVSFVPAVCLFVVCVLRLAIDKPRPYSPDGAGITPFIKKKKQDNKSFPSRHVFSAMVIAMTFLLASPWTWLGLIFVVLSVLLAMVRVLSGVHYISDVMAGAAFAIFAAVVGYIVF